MYVCIHIYTKESKYSEILNKNIKIIYVSVVIYIYIYIYIYKRCYKLCVSSCHKCQMKISSKRQKPVIIIIELTHSKTVLANTVEIELQPVDLDFKNLSKCSSRSK